MRSEKSKQERQSDVIIPAGERRLQGILGLPEQMQGLVIFAHGSGSGRLSPRNNFVAGVLQDGGMATLLVDLLEEPESWDRQKVFDINLLANRVLDCAHWVREDRGMKTVPMGYFGASTGAAAALQAAATEPQGIAAIVSRGGRPDLALPYLSSVLAPTLLIVGGEDQSVIPLNEEAYARLKCMKDVIIVPGASHLFEEPGALDKVADLARDWFAKYFLPQA